MNAIQTNANVTTQLSEARPAVYVGTYHKYNCGSIAGKWVYLDDFDSIEELYKHFAAIHSDEQDPEYMLQDYEHIPESLIDEGWMHKSIYEYINLDEYEKDKIDVIIDAYGSHYYDDVTELIDRLDEFELIETGDTAQDYITEIYPELSEINDKLYWVAIDWERTESDFFTDWAEGTDKDGITYYVSNN